MNTHCNPLIPRCILTIARGATFLPKLRARCSTTVAAPVVTAPRKVVGAMDGHLYEVVRCEDVFGFFLTREEAVAFGASLSWGTPRVRRFSEASENDSEE